MGLNLTAPHVYWYENTEEMNIEIPKKNKEFLVLIRFVQIISFDKKQIMENNSADNN